MTPTQRFNLVENKSNGTIFVTAECAAYDAYDTCGRQCTYLTSAAHMTAVMGNYDLFGYGYDGYYSCQEYANSSQNEYIEPSITEVSTVTIAKDAQSIGVGESKTLNVTINPSNAVDKTLTWESDNPDAVSVSNGVVTGVSEGTAKIRATSSNGKTDVIYIRATIGNVGNVNGADLVIDGDQAGSTINLASGQHSVGLNTSPANAVYKVTYSTTGNVSVTGGTTLGSNDRNRWYTAVNYTDPNTTINVSGEGTISFTVQDMNGNKIQKSCSVTSE